MEKDVIELLDVIEPVIVKCTIDLFKQCGKVINREQAEGIITNIGLNLQVKKGNLLLK